MSTDVPDLASAQRELQRLFDEASELGGPGVDEHGFFAGLLTRLLQSVGGLAGAAWVCDQGALRPACLAGWDKLGLATDPQAAAWHDRLLERCLAEGDELAIDGPGAAAGTDGESGSASWTVYLAPIKFRREVWGLLEVFQEAGESRNVQRNKLTLVQKYAALGGMYLIQRKLAQATASEGLWRDWQGHAFRVAQRLELKHTAAAIANESRRLAGCDRASIVVSRGGKFRLLAASGLEEIDKRAAIVGALERLAKAVCATREPVCVDSGAGELPATAEDKIKDCLELTHAKTLVVLPLIPQADDPLEETDRARTKPPAPAGALILEQMGESVAARQLVARLGPTTRHSTAALANSLAHERIFLLPLWRGLGQALAWLRINALIKSLAIAGGVSSVAAALVFVPAEYEVEARGALQPVHRRDVFAEVDGEVIELRVRHEDAVEAGQVLAVMRNMELDMSRASLEGERSATLERLTGIKIALLTNRELSKAEQSRLNGERLVLEKSLESADRQMELLIRKKGQLQVRSPIAGRVLTWNVRDALLHRPVKRGDALLSVADTAGEWELEVRLPEDRTGHLAEAQQRAGRSLVVRYVAANHPDAILEGTLREVHARAESSADDGNTVLLEVAIDRRQVADLRPGTEVTARVQCGQRPLGYVWFYDAWAFLQEKVFFRWL
jgi:multidrug efflux pump subunit AcrA (membrane-fusion protein)